MIRWHYIDECGYPLFDKGCTVPCLVKVSNSLTNQEYTEVAYCEWRRDNPDEKCFVTLEEGIPIEDISTVYAWERISNIVEHLDKSSVEFGKLKRKLEAIDEREN